jgi:CheY-like chemotaxis protein
MYKIIFVIDDDLDNLLLIKACFKQVSDWHIEGIISSKTALELISAQRRPDGILLDWDMPAMGGQEFMRELRTYFTPDQLPVAVVSAMADEISQELLEELGISFAIAKPYDAILLPSQIANRWGWPLVSLTSGYY